jgi:THO complex subunit 2
VSRFETGNFDLDPSRTLDVLLDVFSDNVVEHWQFFLDVLLASPWAPKRRPEADSHSSTTTNGVESGLNNNKGKQPAVDVGLEREQGSDIIAQILGFKFGFYQQQGAPEVPQGLYTMAALLLWHGTVKLTDLWPHLSPTDDDLVKLESKWRDEQATIARSVGGANALAMAGALTDDDAPVAGGAASLASSSTAGAGKASTSAAPAQPPTPAPNQKVGLLRSLLSIGDITHSFFILGQFPFLVGAFPDIADLLNRLAAVSIAPAYATISISGSNERLAADFKATRSRVTVDSKGGEKKVHPLVKTFALTADAFPSAKHDWTFFFPRWQERVPRAGDFAEVVTLLEEMYLPLLKAFVARQPTLLTKLLRLAAADLGVSSPFFQGREDRKLTLRDNLSQSNPSDHPRRTNWLDLLRSYLVPSISLLEHYPSAALEVWKVLSLFPIETRFQVYGEWKDVHYRRDPALAIRKAEAERDVKSLLRRLSTENVKKLGKTFARVAHTNPTVIFGIALNQVQSYDNLIIPVVEACRYLTDLGYDVMAYSILDALSSNRPKTKEDGTSIAMWLQGLATFTGHVYRRWVSMQPSLWIILQYLVNQLVSGNSKDLVVLRELISRMTAIEPFADLSDAQVASLAGGKYLRSEVFQKTEIAKMAMRGQQDGLAKAKARLASALLGKNLAVPLLVNIALQRQACLKTDAHLKSLGALFDQVRSFVPLLPCSGLGNAADLARKSPSEPCDPVPVHGTPPRDRRFGSTCRACAAGGGLARAIQARRWHRFRHCSTALAGGTARVRRKGGSGDRVVSEEAGPSGQAREGEGEGRRVYRRPGVDERHRAGGRRQDGRG